MQRLLLPFRPGTTGCSSRFLFGGALLRACTSPAASARLGLAGLEALEALEGLPGLAGLLRATLRCRVAPSPLRANDTIPNHLSILS